MKYLEFKNELENGKEYAVYLFEGEDAFFRESGVSLLKRTFVSEPELNFAYLDNDCDLGQLLVSLEGYPFMSKKRMTLIREFYPKQDILKKGLKDYLDNPCPDSIFVIVNEQTSDTLKKFDCVCVVDCSKADPALLIRWVRGECSRANVEIDGQTASLLIDYCLSDMTRIKTETDKLVCYVGGGGRITMQDVTDMVARDMEYKVYELTDYISKSQFDKSLLVIKDMTTKGEQPQRILSYVYNYFRRLLHVAISDLSDSEMAKSFGVKEFAVKKMKDQAKTFKKKALKSAVDMLADSEYMIKSGLANADDRMYLSVFKIMTDR